MLEFKFENLGLPLTYKCEIYLGGSLASKKELLKRKDSWGLIAEKNPLFGIAFIQALKEAGDLEAAFIQCIYHAYKKFLMGSGLKPLETVVDLMLQRNEEGTLKKNLALYIKAVIDKKEIPKECLKAKELLHALMPGFEKSILSKAYQTIKPQLIKINPEQRRHYAFPDLIKFQDAYYVACREGKSHVDSSDLGKIVILKACWNKAESTWHFCEEKCISHKEYDLRDPKFFINKKNELMLIIGAIKLNKRGKACQMVPHVAKLQNEKWELFPAILNKKLFKKGEWIWKVTNNSHDGCFYGLSYGFHKNLSLLKSEDGIAFTEIAKLKNNKIQESLNEATIQFEEDGTLIALIRTERHGLIATSTKASGYQKWNFELLPFRLGGPNFLILPTGEMIAGTRFFFLNENNTLDLATVAAYMDKTSLTPFMRFKTGPDNSYPGMVLEENGEITFVYYSGNEEVSNLFITRFVP